ncbi:MAG TPA: alanine racemase, partial [Paracoccaceae bacterium]|nr:alanine racemase [Paracoccaceae bacterium]
MPNAKLTIDLDAIADNWRALDAKTGPQVETAAVVKANAYGLGVKSVAPALLDAGAKTFFVATPDEGVELRQILGPDPRIFVFSGYFSADGEAYEEFGLTPFLNSAEQVMHHIADRPGAECGLQLDSGMNRLGMEAAEVSTLMFHLPALRVKLVMSHLACADDAGHVMNNAQLVAFSTLSAVFPLTPKSLSATGGCLLGPMYHFNMTRPGIGLYGGAPFTEAKPVVKLELPVLQTRTVLPGEAVGYGATWVAKRPSTIATLGAGYADGILRHIKAPASVFAGEAPCPLVGRVSMDLIAADVTGVAEVPQMMEILNATQTIDVLAETAGTIGYEI